jgi:endonuclease YncB( thermonuclease family)
VFIITCFLLEFLGAQVMASDCASQQIDEFVTVSKVIDGDTVELGDGRRLRLIGIDTPELGNHGEPDQEFAREARSALAAILKDMKIGLQFDDERQDKYQRLLAHVFLSDGTSVTASLLKQGLGVSFVVPPNIWGISCYSQIEEDARETKKGIWGIDAYQVRSSLHITSKGLPGFRVISGQVQEVELGRDITKLILQGNITLRIRNDDKMYFHSIELSNLKGSKVLAKGRLYKGDKGMVMPIRYPNALKLLH